MVTPSLHLIIHLSELGAFSYSLPILRDIQFLFVNDKLMFSCPSNLRGLPF